MTGAAILTFVGSQAKAHLTNEAFDTPYDANTLLPAFLPITTTDLDQWAAESAEIVALSEGIVSNNGDQMVKLLDDGTSGDKYELKQRIDVSLNAAGIDAGAGSAVYFARFNAPAGAIEARATNRAIWPMGLRSNSLECGAMGDRRRRVSPAVYGPRR